MMTNIATAKEVLAEYEDRERLLNWRYPWFNMVFNYVWLFIAVLLIASLIWWSGIVRKEQKDAEAQENRNRAYAAELAQAEEQKQKEFNDMMDRWSKAGAKMLFGIRRFVEKYSYTEKDLETYLRCAWNRYLFYGKLTDLDVLIFTDGQFLECYRTNPSDQYKEFCRKLLMEWYYEDDPPCDPSYVFAELTPKGVFLTDTIEDDDYVVRWRAK